MPYFHGGIGDTKTRRYLILASPLAMGKLAGPEPKNDSEAHAMWQWCRNRGVSIRYLALQFCLPLPIHAIVPVGPATKKEVEEVYEAATTEVPPEVWRDFKAEFGVGL